jgi:GntR family transcriptional regulator/MocR family aminotransferase
MFVQKRHNEKSHCRPLVSRNLDLFVPSVVLDRTSAIPLHRQIRRQIAQSLRDCPGRVEASCEVRLPSTRAMAKILRVSRNTVLAAYDDLAADGLVRGETGSGMWVSGSENISSPLPGLQHVIRVAGYPARVMALADPDGNPLYYPLLAQIARY